MILVLRLGLLAAAVTALRIGVLAISPTDLFFDEAQYWLWGQQLDFGYYSKPPLIAWLIRAVTGLAGSVDPFWVRLPAPVLHGITAVILGLWAASIHRPAALWVAALYLSMPIIGVGSWMISTDTVMAPFLAGGLWAWWRHLATGRTGPAALAGLLVGLAFMAKYAAVYFWIGALVAALACPPRPTVRGCLAALGLFVLVIAPNLVWNFANDLTTLDHTMDNADWVRSENAVRFNWPGLAGFLAAQAAVIGPVFFVALLAAVARAREPGEARLVAFAVPVLLIVTAQAFLARAFANWAFAAYLSAAPLVGIWLVRRGYDRVLRWGLGVNVALCLAVAALIAVPTLSPSVMARYMGRAALADRIFAAAGDRVVLSDSRPVLADLFHARAAQGVDVALAALPPVGRARHYYAQAYPWDGQGDAFFVGLAAPRCDGQTLPPEVVFEMESGAYAGAQVSGYAVPPGCLPSLP